MAETPSEDEWDEFLSELPPASETRGNPGHDGALASARRSQALRLRISGATYDQIAQTVGYTDKGSARHVVMRALERLEAENVEELRAIENARLDADEMVLRRILHDTNTPAKVKIAAINTRIRLSARRSRMNGLDAPTRISINPATDAELADVLSELHELVTGEVVESHDDLRAEG